MSSQIKYTHDGSTPIVSRLETLALREAVEPDALRRCCAAMPLRSLTRDQRLVGRVHAREAYAERRVPMCNPCWPQQVTWNAVTEESSE